MGRHGESEPKPHFWSRGKSERDKGRAESEMAPAEKMDQGLGQTQKGIYDTIAGLTRELQAVPPVSPARGKEVVREVHHKFAEAQQVQERRLALQEVKHRQDLIGVTLESIRADFEAAASDLGVSEFTYQTDSPFRKMLLDIRIKAGDSSPALIRLKRLDEGITDKLARIDRLLAQLREAERRADPEAQTRMQEELEKLPPDEKRH